MFGAAGTEQSNYETVDHLQKILAEQVFSYASDSKKAAGRALGTLVEVVTYYTLCLWGLSDHIVIESKIAEFGNPEISHNVEFSLHSICSSHKVKISPISLPVTPVKIRKYLPELAEKELKTSQVVSSNSVKRNAAVLTKSGSGLVVANVELLNKNQCSLTVCDLFINPLAM